MRNFPISRRRFNNIIAATLVFIGFSYQFKALTSPTRKANENIYYVATTGNNFNPGTIEKPWATIEKAANTLKAGDTVYIRGGTYSITKQIQPQNSGVENQWITYAGYPGESVVIDAEKVNVARATGKPPFPHDQGAFQIEDKSYICIKNIKIINSHNSGFTVRNSHHIELYNNITLKTFTPGIGIWHSQNIKVMGNTVIQANTNEMSIYKKSKKPGPHEAISMGSVQNFEVAYNHVFYCEKEGIDCKGSCAHGSVHHNYIHNCNRQGLYVDGWGNLLEDIELYENVIHDCEVGIAISGEGGAQVNNIRFHHNLVYNNRATGFFFSRWNKDYLRSNIFIYNNTFHHNGYGLGRGKDIYWLTGGLYLYTTNLEDIVIENNIFSDNKYFQIGYSEKYDPQDFVKKNIKIQFNLIFDSEPVNSPVYLEEWAKDHVYATKGTNYIEDDPLFINAKIGNLYLRPLSPAINGGNPQSAFKDVNVSQNYLGALPANQIENFCKIDNFWWLSNFPPIFNR